MGTGLGLMICKKLVSMIGPSSEINVKSEIGKGSSFSFLIYSFVSDGLSGKSINEHKYLMAFKAEDSYFQ